MTAPLRVAILGAAGRMGRVLIEGVASTPTLSLAAVIEHADSEAWRDGRLQLGELPGTPRHAVTVGEALDCFDVLVDFSRPAASVEAVTTCAAAGRPVVIGTTGFDAAQKTSITAAAKRIPVCLSANYSIGVHVCLELLRHAALALGDGYDVEIVEAHHRHKIDAPSGTALAMGAAVADALGRDLATDAIYGREGQTGTRERRSIGFATVRGGDVVGDHSVLFLGDGERVEIAHRATSRSNFARGALRAAAWLPSQPPGVYDMRDVLVLR